MDEIIITEVRKRLKELLDGTHIFTARIGKKGIKINDEGKVVQTIVLELVKLDNGLIIANHLWQDNPLLIKEFHKGNYIEFVGKVFPYKKSVGTIDYNIDIDIDSIKKIKKNDTYGGVY